MNVGILLYIFFYLPKGKTIDVFSFFVIALIVWQISDTVFRIADSQETARFWDRMLCISWLSVGPLLFHFSCRYTGLKKFYTRGSLVAIYLPFLLFFLFYIANTEPQAIATQDPWGWVVAARPNTFDAIQRYFISLVVLASVVILLRYAYRMRNNKKKKVQSLLIAIGILIPAVQGTLTQVVFPYVLYWKEIPITSTCLTFFSVATIIALSRFRLFSISDSIEVGTVLENLTNIVVIISPEKRMMYLNPYARKVFSTGARKRPPAHLQGLFPKDGNDYYTFRREVITKSLAKQTIKNYPTVFITPKGETMDVLISSELIINNKQVQGILLIAYDITEQKKAEQRLKDDQMYRQKEITDAVISAQENERQKIGAELHDNVNQILASGLLYLSMVNIEGQDKEYLLGRTNLMITTAVNEIRKLSHALIPPSLNGESLREAMERLLELAEQAGITEVERDLDLIEEEAIPEKLKLTIYRILQEQLNNVLKYAKAGKITVTLTQESDALVLIVKDNGVGFDSSKRAKGVGLMNIKTRASIHNGIVRIDSEPGAGCMLMVSFPFRNPYLLSPEQVLLRQKMEFREN